MIKTLLVLFTSITAYSLGGEAKAISDALESKANAADVGKGMRMLAVSAPDPLDSSDNAYPAIDEIDKAIDICLDYLLPAKRPSNERSLGNKACVDLRQMQEIVKIKCYRRGNEKACRVDEEMTRQMINGVLNRDASAIE